MQHQTAHTEAYITPYIHIDNMWYKYDRFGKNQASCLQVVQHAGIRKKVKTKAEHETHSSQSIAHSSACKVKADVTLVKYHRHHAAVWLNSYWSVLASHQWTDLGLVFSGNGRINEISSVIHRCFTFLWLVREQMMCQRHIAKIIAQWIPALEERRLSEAPLNANSSVLPLPIYNARSHHMTRVQPNHYISLKNHTHCKVAGISSTHLLRYTVN